MRRSLVSGLYIPMRNQYVPAATIVPGRAYHRETECDSRGQVVDLLAMLPSGAKRWTNTLSGPVEYLGLNAPGCDEYEFRLALLPPIAQQRDLSTEDDGRRHSIQSLRRLGDPSQT